jgi:hypothetical protein
MRLRLFILFLCATLPVLGASSRITLTVTITNTPVATDALTLNADTRTWVDSVSDTAAEILVSTNIGASKTNLYLHIAQSPFADSVVLGQSSTNIVTLAGAIDGAMVASLTGTWAELSYSTQTWETAYAVRVPMSVNPTATSRTNIMSLLSTDLGTYSTSSIPAAATVLALYANLSTAQTLENKTLTNAVSIHFPGNPATFTTNGLVFTADASAVTTNTHYLLTGDAFGWPSIFDSGGSPVSAQPDTTGGIVTEAYLAAYYPVLTDAGLTNVWTRRNEFGVITATEATIDSGSITATLVDAGSTNLLATNTTTSGTFTLGSDLAASRNNNTTLAGGNNAACDFGEDAVYVKIQAGPVASFTINGIADGRDGRILILDNATGQTMTIANDSGVDPTPANRIYTRTGTDVSTGTAGVVALIYDSDAGRWILWTFNAGGSGVTSVALTMPGMFSVSGSPVTGAGTITVSLVPETGWTNHTGHVEMRTVDAASPSLTNVVDVLSTLINDLRGLGVLSE